jgi:hypothetical protein
MMTRSAWCLNVTEASDDKWDHSAPAIDHSRDLCNTIAQVTKQA